MKEFNEIYEKIYKEHYVPLENIRKKAKNKIIIVSLIIIIIAVILSIILQNIFFIIVAVLIIMIYLVTNKSKINYLKLFKEKVINTFIKEYSQELNYLPNQGISQIIYSQGEFERFDKYATEDLISGKLEGGYKINIAEVTTQREEKDDEGNKSYKTIFRGMFGEIEFDKNIIGKIKIRKNQINLFQGKEKLEMDSGEFEKTFDVYTTNKIVAMQLLTSDIMQMFLDFKEQNNIIPELTITSNKLYIRFAVGNVFETNIMKNSLDYDLLLKYYELIKFTLGITEKILKNINDTEI